LAGKLPYVTAMTDVTGFGLLGHLSEVCNGSNLSAEVEFSKVPKFSFLDDYIAQKSIPGGTNRNWDSYGSGIVGVNDNQRAILADPQTSGGLLIAVEESATHTFESFLSEHGISAKPFGRL